MVYFGNLCFNLVVDGEQDSGNPNEVMEMKQYSFKSNGPPS